MPGNDDGALGKAHVPYGSDGSGLYSAATLGGEDEVYCPVFE